MLTDDGGPARRRRRLPGQGPPETVATRRGHASHDRPWPGL